MVSSNVEARFLSLLNSCGRCDLWMSHCTTPFPLADACAPPTISAPIAATARPFMVLVMEVICRRSLVECVFGYLDRQILRNRRKRWTSAQKEKKRERGQQLPHPERSQQCPRPKDKAGKWFGEYVRRLESKWKRSQRETKDESGAEILHEIVTDPQMSWRDRGLGRIGVLDGSGSSNPFLKRDACRNTKAEHMAKKQKSGCSRRA